MSDPFISTLLFDESTRCLIASFFCKVERAGGLQSNNPFIATLLADEKTCKEGATVLETARLLTYVAASTPGVRVPDLVGATWANIVKAADVYGWKSDQRFGKTTAPEFGVRLLRACKQTCLSYYALPPSPQDAVVFSSVAHSKLYPIGTLLEFVCTHICPLGKKRPLQVIETGVVCGYDPCGGYEVMASSRDDQGVVSAVPFFAAVHSVVVLPHQVRILTPALGDYATRLRDNIHNDFHASGTLDRLEGDRATVSLDSVHTLGKRGLVVHCSLGELVRSMPSYKVPGNEPTSPTGTPPASPISPPSSPERFKRSRSE